MLELLPIAHMKAPLLVGRYTCIQLHELKWAMEKCPSFERATTGLET